MAYQFIMFLMNMVLQKKYLLPKNDPNYNFKSNASFFIVKGAKEITGYDRQLKPVFKKELPDILYCFLL